MIEMNDKLYKKVRNAGAAGIVMGILVLVGGITIGVVSIVYGGNLLSIKKHLVD